MLDISTIQPFIEPKILVLLNISYELFSKDEDIYKALVQRIGIWNWGNLEWSKCCPFCGSFCGMHFQEASYTYHCLNCDTLTSFDFLSHEEEG